MFKAEDIHSVTDFIRNSREHIRRLANSGQPEVLTVNGKAQVVVQDAQAYQRLLDDVEYAQTVRTLRERIAAYQRGEPGVAPEEAFLRIRKALGLDAES